MSHNMALLLIITHSESPELSSTANIFGDYAWNITSIFICLLLLLLLLLCAFLVSFFLVIDPQYTSPLLHLSFGKKTNILRGADSKQPWSSMREGWVNEQTNVCVLILWLNAQGKRSDRVIMRKHCRLQNTADRHLWNMMHLTGGVCICEQLHISLCYHWCLSCKYVFTWLCFIICNLTDVKAW